MWREYIFRYIFTIIDKGFIYRFYYILLLGVGIRYFLFIIYCYSRNSIIDGSVLVRYLSYLLNISIV